MATSTTTSNEPPTATVAGNINTTSPPPHNSSTTPQSPAEEPHDPNSRPACFASTTQECLFVFTVTMAVAMSAFLLGSVTVISSFAGRDLDMTRAEVGWMNGASSLTSGALLLPFGTISDNTPRKPLFILSLALFSLFSLAASFSRTGLTLDILNGVLGIFSAAAVPPAQGMLGRVYSRPSERKNRAFACFSAGNPLGFVFGTILSGCVTRAWGWRSSFWLLCVVYAVVVGVAVVTVPGVGDERVRWDERTVRRLDLPGTGLTILGVGMFVAALSLGADAPQGWKTHYVLVLLILGILFIVAFLVWETKYPDAMIPMNIWKDRDFSLLLAILSLGMLAFPVFSFWIALYFQEVLHLDSLMTGVRMLPMVVMGIGINVLAALILHKVSNKLLMGIGAFAYFVSFLLAAVQRHGDSYWAFAFPALSLCVLGADFEFNVANMYVLSSLPLNRQSIAGSLVQTLSRICTAVGYGVATAIFNGVLRNPAESGYYKNNAAEPYAAVFWFAASVSGASVLLVPFLKIGTQGHKGDVGKSGGDEKREELVEDVGGEKGPSSK